MSSTPFVQIEEEVASEIRDRRDAIPQLDEQGKSTNFIAVRLKQLYSPEWRERFGPVKKIRVERSRVGINGNKQVIDVSFVDGQVYFNYDNQTGYHLAYFYDDDDKYNRAVLATHRENGEFMIIDPTTDKEVGALAKKIMKAHDAKEKPVTEVPLTDTNIAEMDIETINTQMEYLQKIKNAAIEKKKNEAAPTSPPAGPDGGEKPEIGEEKTAETKQKSAVTL